MIHGILTLATELLDVSIVAYHIRYMVDHYMHVWSDILFGVSLIMATKTSKELHPLLALIT